MLSIGHVHIRQEELRSVSFNGADMALEFEWPDSDLPLLLQLEEESLLRFGHLPPGESAISAQVVGWRCARRATASSLWVLVQLRVSAVCWSSHDQGRTA